MLKKAFFCFKSFWGSGKKVRGSENPWHCAMYSPELIHVLRDGELRMKGWGQALRIFMMTFFWEEKTNSVIASRLQLLRVVPPVPPTTPACPRPRKRKNVPGRQAV